MTHACGTLTLTFAADAVQQAISEAAQDVLDSVGPRTAARPPASRGLGLAQSALCQQALQHDHVVCNDTSLLLRLYAVRCVGVFGA